ncbi:hypothetical protein QTI33_21250 [Variovorax sp. J22P271]|uniref:hypothetical protein n=1 Tax=Variovorax davisae TaxID=3053515 RepID=UPI00257790BC|nr:hypothetical protein [Variovorax sp. J22P271]MDM0034678.1 hypothetical protein [Variovorax sp. J22P271]
MARIFDQVARSMQPVVELRREAATYTYGVRAPRAGGVVPPVSFNEGGFASLAACLLHVARGMGGNFPCIYVRLEGQCVGERAVAELQREPERVAAELEAACRAGLGVQQPQRPVSAAETLSG